MDGPGIRNVPFDLADLVDRPPLKRLDEIDDGARAGVRAEFVNRTAVSFLEQARQLESMEAAELLAETAPSKLEELVDEVERLHTTLVKVVIRDPSKNPADITVRTFRPPRRSASPPHRMPFGIAVEVLKDDDGWVIVSGEGARVGSPSYSTKKDAVEIARTVARMSKGTLCVYGTEGKITEQRSYQPVVTEIEIRHDII